MTEPKKCKKSLEQKVLWSRWLKKYKNLDLNGKVYLRSKAQYDAWPYNPQYMFDPTHLYEYLSINDYGRYVRDGGLAFPTCIDREFGDANLSLEARRLFTELLHLRFGTGKNFCRDPEVLFKLIPENSGVDFPRFSECLEDLIASEFLIYAEGKD